MKFYLVENESSECWDACVICPDKESALKVMNKNYKDAKESVSDAIVDEYDESEDCGSFCVENYYDHVCGRFSLVEVSKEAMA